MNKWKKGWKVFDKNLKCQNFQYKIGKTYKYDGEINLCNTGFHFSTKIIDCFNYEEFNPKNRVCIISFSEKNTKHGEDKSVTKKIKIISEISWEEVLRLCNSGYGNSGYRNSGDRNSGDWNSGDSNSGDSNSGDCNSGYRNSGDWNSGDRNSGYWNSGDRNSGYCNIEKAKLRIFDKETDIKNTVFPSFFYFDLLLWINEKDMSNAEKKENPNFYVQNGYLKHLGYKDAWRKSWNLASEEDKKKVFDIPNWNNEKFLEISGINVEKELSI